MRLNLIVGILTFTLIASIGAQTPPDTSPIMAETDLGPVTLNQLRDYLVNFGDLRNGALTTREDWDLIPQLLRETAAQQILLHLAEERGIISDPQVQTELELIEEKVILDVFTQEHIVTPSYPTRDEMWEQVYLHRADHPLPARASFRFMRFAPNEASPEEAMSLARQATAALASGEGFADVAARLATPPSSGIPGEMLNQVEYEGQVLPELQEAIRITPLQEPSEIIDTDIGPMIIWVDWRELERFESDGNLMFTYGIGLANRRRDEYRAHLLEELEEKYGMELFDYLEGSVTPEAPAVIAGNHILTMNDIQRRANTSANPELAYQVLRQESGLRRLGHDMLLLCEADAIGLSTSPEVLNRIETQRIHYLTETTSNDILLERLPSVEPAEALAHYEAHQSDFEQELFTFELFRLSDATLSRLASSELGIDRLHVMETLRQRLIDGESGQQIAQEWELHPENGDVARLFGRKPLSAISDLLRDSVASLASGECGQPQIGRDGAQLINVLERGTGIPLFEDIRPQVITAYNRSRIEGGGDLRDELVEEYHWRLIGDPTRVRWADEIMGSLTLVGPSDEE